MTREHIKVDRAACPWLITRFVLRLHQISRLRLVVAVPEALVGGVCGRPIPWRT